MEIYLTQTQIDQIRALYLAGANAQGNFSHIYKFIGDLLPESDEKNWFRGAEQANAGQGAYSALIRTYSQRQMQLRSIGGLYTPELMQAASDEVATNALKDILGLDGYPSRVQPDGTSLFPTMVDIAKNDATGVSDILFASLPVGDSARGDKANAGWSGTIFFSALNAPQTDRLISANGPTLDVLEDLKHVLFVLGRLKHLSFPIAVGHCM